MVSISHWGMFEVVPRVLIVPKGFKMSDQDIAEWNRAAGIIEIVPDKRMGKMGHHPSQTGEMHNE